MDPINWLYIGIALVVCQIIPFIVYGIDKRLAIKGKSRISELSLLVLTFLFGIIGSFLAMIIFRHKTIKGSFRAKFAVVTIVRVLVLGGIVTLLIFVF